MHRNEFSSPAFGVTRESGGLRVSLPVKTDRFRSLLNLVWVLVWATGEVALILFALGRAAPAPSLPLARVLLAAFTVAGGVVMWRWLWCVGGRETFLITRDALWARWEIWGVGRSRKFDLEKIRSVKAALLKYRVIYPSWGRMFIGHDESEVVIDSAGRTFAYGKGLEDSEAGDLVDLLNEEMGYRFHKQLVPKARSAYLS